MNARMRFSRAIDSLFKHMGDDGFYQTLGAEQQAIRVILRQPDPLFDLGDRHIVVEQYRIDVRLAELPKPLRGASVIVNGTHYRIEDEPKLDQHQLVWLMDALPIVSTALSDSTQNTRLRMR